MWFSFPSWRQSSPGALDPSSMLETRRSVQPDGCPCVIGAVKIKLDADGRGEL